MHVSNLTSPRSGNPVANQYELNDVNGVNYFQSYQTVIASKGENHAGHYKVSSDWRYSRTTSKYFAQWLRCYGWRDDEIERLKNWLRHAKYGAQYEVPTMSGVIVEYVEGV